MGAKAHTDLVKAALKYLELQGIVCWKNNTGTLKDRTGRPVSYGCAGSADIIGVLPGGRFFGAEAKTGAGRLSVCQRDWMSAVNDAGGLVFVFRNLEDVERRLRNEEEK